MPMLTTEQWDQNSIFTASDDEAVIDVVTSQVEEVSLHSKRSFLRENSEQLEANSFKEKQVPEIFFLSERIL